MKLRALASFPRLANALEKGAVRRCVVDLVADEPMYFSGCATVI